MIPLPQRTLGEACGVFGAWLPGQTAAPIALTALYALQHRGQESAGIAMSTGSEMRAWTGMGLVRDVFRRVPLPDYAGEWAIGHTRYSTSGQSTLHNAQPFVVECPPHSSVQGRVALAHNGTLTDTSRLAAYLRELGIVPTAESDSALLASALAAAPGATWPDKIRWAVQRVEGSFSLVILTHNRLFAVRDPLGNRPLCVGKLAGGWVVASESCALAAIDATLWGDLPAGALVEIASDGPRVLAHLGRPDAEPGFCAFEYIYLMRPDSVVGGRSVYRSRQAMGRLLARDQPAPADVVAAVPDSGTAAALGYAQETGLPYVEVLTKNRYIGRTFIAPGADERLRDVALKFSVLAENVVGRSIVLIDDSLVRGTTTRSLVRLLRRAGARAIHLRIAAPPVRHPCPLGVDIPTFDELIAHERDEDTVCRLLAADSLAYLSRASLAEAVDQAEKTLCMGCLGGRFPLPHRRREQPPTPVQRVLVEVAAWPAS